MRLPKMEPDVLYIFTDASVTKYCNVEYISCSGAVAVVASNDPHRDHEIIDEIFQVNRCSTNNNGEIRAVYLGILLALKHRANFKEVNLFSDSKISIYGLREWIKQWVLQSVGCNSLIGSQHTPVSNQQEILSCIYTIMANNLSINLYYQRGHCNTDKTIYGTALKKFKSNNEITDYVSDEFMELICQMNNYVDWKSRDILGQYMDIISDPPRNMPTELAILTYNPFNIDGYLGLVKN